MKREGRGEGSKVDTRVGREKEEGVPLTFSFAQLAKGKSLGPSKPATKSQIQSLATHCVDYFYYIQALLNCLL